MARPPPKSTPGQWALKSSRQKRASMIFLRGGMKPRACGEPAAVSAEATGAVACVAAGLLLEAPAASAPDAAAPDVCAAAFKDAVKAFFLAAFASKAAGAGEEPCAAFAFDWGAPCPVEVAASAVPLDVGVAAADDAEPSGVDLTALSVPAGDGEVAGSAAAAAGLVSVAGFAAVAAVPEPEGGVAVAITAFTAC